jgi:outer membrane receptor for ferrienterochelin and colicin
MSMGLTNYLTISLKAHNVGERVYYDSQTGAVAGKLKSYTVSDLNVITEHNDVQIALRIYNLGNQTNYFDTYDYPMPERSWLLTFGTKF